MRRRYRRPSTGSDRDLRRPEPGRQRRSVGVRHSDATPRAGGVDRLDGAPRRPSRRRTHPGRKVLTLVHAIIAGATHIDHVDVLRAGSTEAVLGHRVMAPSTIGTFLRSFTFGHVRQLEAVIGRALNRLGTRCRTQRGAVGDRCRLDDLRGCRQGQARRRLRLHEGPRVSPDHRHPGGQRLRALHARTRQRPSRTPNVGHAEFIDELVARHRSPAAATGESTMRSMPGSGPTRRSRR